MSDFVLSCCSTCDMSEEWHERRNVLCVYFNYELAGEPCKDDYGRTHAPADLYARYLRDSVGMDAVYLPSTSPANAAWTLPRLEVEWGEKLSCWLVE